MIFMTVGLLNFLRSVRESFYFTIHLYCRVNNFQIRNYLAYHKNVVSIFKCRNWKLIFTTSMKQSLRRKPFMNWEREVETFQRYIQPILVLLNYLKYFQAFFLKWIHISESISDNLFYASLTRSLEILVHIDTVVPNF